jgi:hypothetical protein
MYHGRSLKNSIGFCSALVLSCGDRIFSVEAIAIALKKLALFGCKGEHFCAAAIVRIDRNYGTGIERPLSRAIAETLHPIPRDSVPDMPDRIIAATALHLNLLLVTRDRKIQSLEKMQIIW